MDSCYDYFIFIETNERKEWEVNLTNITVIEEKNNLGEKSSL